MFGQKLLWNFGFRPVKQQLFSLYPFNQEQFLVIFLTFLAKTNFLVEKKTAIFSVSVDTLLDIYVKNIRNGLYDTFDGVLLCMSYQE